MTVGALLLAAGLSRRMGGAKLAMPVDGVPMIARCLASASAAELPVLVVTGGHESAVLAAIGDAPRVYAVDHALGLAHSLRAGLDALPAAWDGFLVMLGDMPFVAAATLRALADALAAGAPAVVPVSGGRRGNPAGFSRGCVAALMTLSGDRGAGTLLDSLGVVEVRLEDAGVLRDLDVPSDLSAPM